MDFPCKKEHICKKNPVWNLLLKGNQSFAIRPKTSKHVWMFCNIVNIFLKTHAKFLHINHKNPPGTNLFLYFYHSVQIICLSVINKHSNTHQLTHAAVKKDVPFTTKQCFLTHWIAFEFAPFIADVLIDCSTFSISSCWTWYIHSKCRRKSFL